MKSDLVQDQSSRETLDVIFALPALTRRALDRVTDPSTTAAE
jgi:hypothetical protein